MNRITIAIAALVLSTAAVAQQQAPSTEEIDARIQTLSAQREEQANRVVIMSGMLAKLQKELDAAKKEAAECKPKPKEK